MILKGLGRPRKKKPNVTQTCTESLLFRGVVTNRDQSLLLRGCVTSLPHLFLRDEERLLEDDPGDGLEQRGRRQRAGIRPEGLALGQELQRVDLGGEGRPLALVADGRELVDDLLQLLVDVVVGLLEEHAEDGEAVGLGGRLAGGGVLAAVPVDEVELREERRGGFISRNYECTVRAK